MCPELDNKMQLSLNEIDRMKDKFMAEFRERETTSKTFS